MSFYNKKELLSKLSEGKDLKEDEYKVLIKNGRYEMETRLILFDSEDYTPTIIEYTTLGLLSSQMNYLDDEKNTIRRASIYMLTSLEINNLNHLLCLNDSNTALKHLCRFNTINFLNEVNEVKNYDTLIGYLHDSICETLNMGYNYNSLDDIEDRMEDLEESRKQLILYRKKYIK